MRGHRILRAVGFTAALVLGVAAVDRLALTPPPRPWVAAAALEGVPPEAGPLLVPAYLPRPLAWPPETVLWREGEHAGWWLGLDQGSGTPPRLWVGTTAEALPAALGEAAACLGEAGLARCPRGWHHLSTALDDGRTVQVVGRLPPAELRRILAGLGPRTRPPLTPR